MAALVVLLVVAVVAIAHNLDRPFLKDRLRAQIASAARVDVDWRSVDVQLLSGIAIDGLVIRTTAGELATARRVSAAWTTALYTKQRIDRAALEGVSVHVIVDEHGKTNLDDLTRSDKPAEAPKPLSRTVADALATVASLPTIEVTDLSGELVRTENGVAVDRMQLEGLGLHADAHGARLGAQTAPLALNFTRQLGDARHVARAKLALDAQVTSTDVATSLDLAIDDQDFLPGLVASHVVHSEAHAHVDLDARTTSIAVERTTVAGGIATTTAMLDLPDDGPVLVRKAEGEIDFVRLVAFVPAGILPFKPALARGHLRYDLERIVLGALPALNEGAKVNVDGDLADVKIPGIAEAANAKISARAEGLQAHAEVVLDRAKAPGTAADDLSLTLDALQDGRTYTGKLSAAFSALSAPGGVHGKKAKVAIDFTRLDPATRSGELAITTELDALDVPSARLRQVAMSAHGSLHGPLDADVRAASVTAAGATFAPVHVATAVRDLVVADAPAASTAVAHVVVDAGDAHVQLDATKTADAVDYELAADAASLGLVRTFVPGEVPVARMGLVARSRGRIENLARMPALTEHTELQLAHPGYLAIGAERLAVTLDSKGDANRHELKADLAFTGLAVSGTQPGDDRVTLDAGFDRASETLRASVKTRGRLTANVDAKLGWDRARRGVRYDLVTHLGDLAPAGPLLGVLGLDGLDVSKLAIDLKSRGEVLGAVTSIQPLAFAPELAKTVGVDGTIDLKAKDVAWGTGSTLLGSPLFGFEAKLSTKGDRRTVESHLDVAEFHFANGPAAFEVAGVKDRTVFTISGDLTEPEMTVEQQLEIGSLASTIASRYPVKDTKIAFAAKRTKDGVIHVSSFEANNPAGGTVLSLKGAIDPTELQRRLALAGTLRQDLGKLSSDADRLYARGSADVKLRIESPDLALFRTIGDVRLAGVDVRLPAQKISLEGAEGMLPIAVAVRFGPRGPRIARESGDNPYKSLRYADQHPLLSRSSYLTFRKLDLPQVTINGFAGNLQIEQNIISLRQFEMGVRDGRVTGSLSLDWRGPESTLEMHVRADGVKSSHGEPFTGNAALLVSAADHTVEGRADILQIGKRHLLDLLDLQDPFHADAGINRIRSAMFFGYPDKLRLTFNHGFAGLHLEMGGLARIISIDDIKGVPIGPLVDRFIPPIIPAKEEP